MTSAPLAATDLVSAIVQLGPLALIVLLYARRSHTLHSGPHAVPAWRAASFYAGCATIALALIGLGPGADELLALHMVEHLLVGDVAALLIVLGLTGPLIAPVLRIGFFNRLRALANPAIALPLWAFDLYIWHLPLLYEAALRSGAVHALEHILFLACGVNLWMCLFGPLPMPSWFTGGPKALYVLGYWFVGTLLANALIWVDTPFYPFYASGDASWHISRLTDQQLAGAAMMIECSVVTLSIGTWLFMTALREAGERQELVDYARARGVELSSERAGRAVRAGRAAELRLRVEELGRGAHTTPAPARLPGTEAAPAP